MNFSLLSDRRRVLLLLNLLSGGGKGISVSGTSPITLANAIKGKLKKLVQFGKVSVNGSTITCNNGVLSADGDSIITTGTAEVVTVTGANLCNTDVEVGNFNTNGINADDPTRLRTVGFIPVESGKTVIVSAKSSLIDSFALSGYPSDAYVVARIQSTSWQALRTTVTIADGVKFIRLNFRPNPQSTRVTTDDLSELMVEYGETPSPYAPYVPPQIVSDIPNLYAVDSLMDEHDLVSGKTIRRTEAVISDGTTPTGRYVGDNTAGNVIIKARETLYEDDAVVSFETEEEKPLNLVKASFSPIQDLHGYSNPWPAGGGANIFDKDATQITNLAGIDFTKICYCSANVAAAVLPSVTVIGFSAGCQALGIPVKNGDKVKIYFFNGLPSTLRLMYVFTDSSGNIIASRTQYSAYGNVETITISEDAYMFLEWAIGTDVNDGIVITKNESSVQTKWTPYENLCPIDGWDRADIGKVHSDNLMPTPTNFAVSGYNTRIYEEDYPQIWAAVRAMQPGKAYRTRCNGTFRDDGTTFSGFDMGITYSDSSFTTVRATGMSGSIKALPVTAINFYIGGNSHSGYRDVSRLGLWQATSAPADVDEFVGQYIPIKFGALGKNLCPKFTYLSNNGITLTDRVNGYVASGTASNTANFTSPAFTIRESGNYTISGLPAKGVLNQTYRLSVEVNGRTPTVQYDTSKQYTLEAGDSVVIRLQIFKNFVSDGTTFTPQCELGSSTSYEPYNDTVYGGYLRINRDGSVDLVGTEAKAIATDTITVQSESRPVGSDTLRFYTNQFLTDFATTSADNADFCNYFDVGLAPLNANNEDNTLCIYNKRLYFRADMLASSSDAQTWLRQQYTNGTPLYVVGHLSEPVIYHLPSIDALKSYDGVNNVWHSANGKITVALAEADIVEQGTPQPIRLSEGTNTITVTANVEGIQFDVLYKGNQPEESAPLNSFSSSSFSSLNNPFNPGLSTMDTEPEDIPLDDQTGDLEDLQEEPEASDIDA